VGTIRKILAKIKELEEKKLEKYLTTLEENSQIEFKKSKNSFPKEALETYSAFANTDGGLLILGIEETKEGLNISGVANPEKVKKEMFDLLNNPERVSKNILIDENIVEKIIDDKTVIIIDIPRAYYKDKPIYLGGNPRRSFKRNYEGDYRCTEQEMRIMIQDSSDESLDNGVIEDFTIDDLDPVALKGYRQRFALLKEDHPFKDMDDLEFFEKLKVLRKNRKKGISEVTLGGLLVFGKSEAIREVLPFLHMEYIDKSDPSKERWVDRLIYDGTWEDNFYNFFYLAINKIYKTVATGFKMMDDHITRAEESETHIALREALVNSIIHANFKINSPLKITRYADCFEFENPGTLRISQEDFFEGNHSDPRNQIIQEVFRMINLCERAGSGVPKILKAVKENDYRYPDIEENEKRFLFKFWDIKNKLYSQRYIETVKGLTQEEKDILLLTAKNNYITNIIIQNELKLPKSTVNRILLKLLEQGHLKKEGQGRGTKYRINYKK
jgi:predicted HTH transcriptional regulator